MANNPKSEIKSPSDYFHYELFPQNLIYEILKYDYNDLDIEDTLNTNNPYQIPFIKAIQGKSFKNIFDIIFKEAATNYPLGFEDLGGILDIISSCLEFEPTKRPTIKSLLQSELFSLDRYQLLNSQ
jgi:serine/threonine protein kinase